jgi:hypothetical protein
MDLQSRCTFLHSDFLLSIHKVSWLLQACVKREEHNFDYYLNY